MSKPTVVCCAEFDDPEWRWLAPVLEDTGLDFEIVRCVSKHRFTRNRRLNLARLLGSFNAVRIAKRRNAVVLVAHGPTLAAWCAIFARLWGVKALILAHSFNFTTLPGFAKRRVFAFAFSKISRFVVYSTLERQLYATAFQLPVDRFDVVLWGVQPPLVDTPVTPIEPGRYVCAIGGNARDYSTLIATARQLPDIRFVLVVRPDSLLKLELPSNVTTHTDIPFGVAMNVLLHSQFMVLPLIGSEVPCGHVTLVAAMHLGKAFVITDSAGIRDYVRDGENALTIGVGSVAGLTATTRRLWENPTLCAQLGTNGREFAARECSEMRIAQHFRDWARINRLGCFAG